MTDGGAANPFCSRKRREGVELLIGYWQGGSCDFVGRRTSSGVGRLGSGPVLIGGWAGIGRE